jgi:release factor glutamine methyltransferase
MTVKNWLADHSQKLKSAGIESARLDCLMLLETILSKDRTWILANQNYKIPQPETQKLKKLFSQRLSHKPMAYILEECEFYGRKFVISPAVLQPRPESESFFTLLPNALKNIQKPKIADVGCGSGILGITTALEYPNSTVDLIDIDKKALEIANINVNKYTTPLNVICSYLLEDAPSNYDVLLCNLPYVPDGYPVNKAVLHEPTIAVFGGNDGLDLYRRLAVQIENLQKKPLFLLTESLDTQQPEMVNIFSKNWLQIDQK